MQFEKTMGRKHKREQDLDCPKETGHLWSMFIELWDLNIMTFPDFNGYLKLKKYDLTLWEIDLLMKMIRKAHG